MRIYRKLSLLLVFIEPYYSPSSVLKVGRLERLDHLLIKLTVPNSSPITLSYVNHRSLSAVLQQQLSVVQRPSGRPFSVHLWDSIWRECLREFFSTFLSGRYATTASRYLEIQRLFCSRRDLKIEHTVKLIKKFGHPKICCNHPKS